MVCRQDVTWPIVRSAFVTRLADIEAQVRQDQADRFPHSVGWAGPGDAKTGRRSRELLLFQGRVTNPPVWPQVCCVMRDESERRAQPAPRTAPAAWRIVQPAQTGRCQARSADRAGMKRREPF